MLFESTLKEAQEAFWKVVKTNHPEATVPLVPTPQFDEACAQVVLANLPAMNLPQYRQAFPSFGSLGLELSELPVEFVDFSWKNDACPRFEAPGNAVVFPRLILWVEFEDSKQRESGSEKRYLLLLGKSDEEVTCGEATVLIETDSVNELSASIRQAAQQLTLRPKP